MMRGVAVTVALLVARSSARCVATSLAGPGGGGEGGGGNGGLARW